MVEQHSTIATAAGLIARTLVDYGFDAAELFAHAGLNIADIDKVTTRFPGYAMRKLWRLVASKTGDPCFAIAAGERIQPAAMHGVGFAWLASDTLHDALTRLVRYQRALSTVAKVSLEEKADTTQLVIDSARANFDVDNLAFETAMVVFVRMSRLASASEFSPARVTLCRSKPDCSQRIEAFFQAPVEYDARQNSLYFTTQELFVPLPNANSELARANDQVVIDYLDRFDQSQVSMQVRARIIEALPSGQPTQSKIAGALNLSLRNLQRKLQAEKTNFKTLLDGTRQELATHYIRETHRSIGEITYLLGFAETSNFTRAFKRWTGKSPMEYRQQV